MTSAAFAPEVPEPGTRTILIIEDSPTVRTMLRGAIQRGFPGVTVVEAAEGRQALHELTRCRPCLVVTDLQMPGMDGRSFLGLLRRNALLRRKKVLVLSGDDLTDLRALYAGDDGIRFLAKSGAIQDLLQTMQDLLPSPAARVVS